MVQTTSLRIVYSTVYSGTNQRKHQSSASLAFVRGFPAQRASNAENVCIWWRHHEIHIEENTFISHSPCTITLGKCTINFKMHLQWNQHLFMPLNMQSNGTKIYKLPTQEYIQPTQTNNQSNNKTGQMRNWSIATKCLWLDECFLFCFVDKA